MCTRAPTHTHKSYVTVAKEKCSYLVWKKNFIFFFLQQQKLVYHLPIRRFPSIWTVICLLAAVSSRNNSNKFINRMIEDYRDGHGRVYDFVFISFASTINHSLRFSCALFCVHWSLLLCCVFKNILLRFAVLFWFVFFFLSICTLARTQRTLCVVMTCRLAFPQKRILHLNRKKQRCDVRPLCLLQRERHCFDLFFFSDKNLSVEYHCALHTLFVQFQSESS